MDIDKKIIEQIANELQQSQHKIFEKWSKTLGLEYDELLCIYANNWCKMVKDNALKEENNYKS